MQSAIDVAVKWTPQQLLKRHAARKKKLLFKTGAYTKTSMQRSMRYAKKPSKPGEPPHAHKDSKKGPLLRKLINFSVDLEEESVIAGPMKSGISAKSTPEVLDQSGRVPVANLLKERKVTIGSTAPIRYLGGGRFAGVPIKTQAQADRAERLVKEENAVRAGKGSITIAARPFTTPALTDGGKKLHELTETIPL